jgi:hypothetical protein
MLDNLFLGFWTTMVFASIAWYAYLLFHVGVRGGFDIVRMMRALSAAHKRDKSS